MESTINIAVSKGRVFSALSELLTSAGLMPSQSDINSRKLVLNSKQPGVKIVIIRGADVPTYVAHGVTELGIVGKDMLMEYEGGGIYEILDLGVGRCRLMVASSKDMDMRSKRIRVATKYVNSTREYFSRQGVQAEIIKLYGSVELSPLVGLADYIVDLVDTGGTLAENGLVVKDKIADISARLIVNKAIMKMKFKELKTVIEQIEKASTPHP